MGSLLPGSLDNLEDQTPEDFKDKKEEELGQPRKSAEHVPWWIKGTKEESKIKDLDHKLQEEQHKKEEAYHESFHKNEHEPHKKE